MITTPRIVIQTGSSLAVDGWSTTRWRFQSSTDQVEAMGSAILLAPYGSIIDNTIGIEEDRPAPTIADLGGLLVRFLCEDDAGSITIPGWTGWTFSAFWYGKVKAVEERPTGGGGGTVAIECVEVGALLKDLTLRDGAQLMGNGTSAYITPYLAPFNHIPAGDRSAAKKSIAGTSVYVHDLSVATTGTKWTAADILEHVLALNWGGTNPGLSVNDPTGALAYEPEDFSADGQTLYALVNSLCSASRGLCWWLEVSGSNLVIQVQPTVADAIAVGSYTLPAASLTAALVANANTSGLTLTTVVDDTADEIEIVGARPTVICTLNLKSTSTTALVADTASSLRAGWNSGQETAWNSWAANPRTNLPGGTADLAWARFELNPAWLGIQAPSTAGTAASNGLRTTATAAFDASYGEGGKTGALTYDAAEPLPSAWALRAVHELPASLGWDTLRIGPRQPPVIILGSGSLWYDMSSSWRLQIEESPPAIVIDDGEGGAAVRARLLEGHRLFVTIALQEWNPLRVSWIRPTDDRPLSTQRRRRIQMPKLGEDLLLLGTVTGVNDDTGYGTDVTRRTGTDLTIRSDLPVMRRLLAYYRAWYENPATIVTWSQRGSLANDATLRPGALLLTVNDGHQVHTVGATIISRTRRLIDVDGAQVVETSYQTDVRYPDLDLVL